MQRLQEITITADRPLQPVDGAVENMSRVVCALLMKALRNEIETPDFWKISIRINSASASEDNKVLLGVLVKNRSFPSHQYVAWSRHQREGFMLRFVCDTLSEILESRGIDPSPVEAASRVVVESGFLNMIVGKKAFRRPDGGEVARIECVQDIEEARVYVSLQNKSGEKRRVLVARTPPEEFIFQAYFGRVEWDGTVPYLIRADASSIELNAKVQGEI